MEMKVLIIEESLDQKVMSDQTFVSHYEKVFLDYSRCISKYS